MSALSRLTEKVLSHAEKEFDIWTSKMKTRSQAAVWQKEYERRMRSSPEGIVVFIIWALGVSGTAYGLLRFQGAPSLLATVVGIGVLIVNTFVSLSVLDFFKDRKVRHAMGKDGWAPPNRGEDPKGTDSLDRTTESESTANE